VNNAKHAVPVGTLNGRRVYRVPVRVDFNDSQQCATVARREFTVLAYSAADAANWARDRVATRPETEIYAWGPKGATVKRYIGWQSALAAELFDRSPRAVQLTLDLAEVQP
jgi:hypothetical protein